MSNSGGIGADKCRVEQLEEQLAQAEKDAADMSAELCDLQQELDAARLSISETPSKRIPEPYPGFDGIPTPRTDQVDVSGNWDTPDKLAELCRQLEREVTLADDSYAELCKKRAAEEAYAGLRTQQVHQLLYLAARLEGLWSAADRKLVKEIEATFDGDIPSESEIGQCPACFGPWDDHAEKCPNKGVNPFPAVRQTPWQRAMRESRVNDERGIVQLPTDAFNELVAYARRMENSQGTIRAEGWAVPGPWIACNERLPADETPVLILLNGAVRIGELRWERPGFEDTYKAFRYWDDPVDDGQCWEWPDVTHWMALPAPPESSPATCTKSEEADRG